MKDDHTSKRMAGALIMTAFLAAFFLMIAAYGPGVAASTAAAHNITGKAPARDGTEPPRETETHHPEVTRTRTPEATETNQGERTHTPEPTRTHEIEPTETHEVEPTETEEPEETHPPRTRTPEATETHEVEPTETEHPERTRTPEPTRTHEIEPTETEHPERTHTPEATETEHPERTETPHATRTGVPSPEPTELAPLPSRGNGTSGSPASIPGTGSRTFAPTGKTVQGVFLQYWDKNGGLQQQGYPISGMMQERSPLDGKVYTVQYFERAVFEFHPENAAPYNVLLSQLGTFRYKTQYPTGVSGQIVNRTDAAYFPQTQHYVGGTFLKYWQQHGGLAQQGYPLSDEFTEISPLDGKPYRVQYFERAVFELHPENAAPYNVLLSQVGTFRYKTQYNGK